ncbi:MAG: hypothetical protein A2X49_04385 [Lentisphaerae bacterium GWF2_52_8]|nr:MAG: hypothetical protein A2X49_04385 [Lentisphaerae bacterium GWF2_52_8]
MSYSLGMQALLKSLRGAFLFLTALIVGMLAWYVLGAGYFEVAPQEKVIVLRFGKYMETYNDGWHWVPPYPVSTILRIPSNQQTLTVSRFMPDRSGSVFKSNEEKAMENPGKPLVPGQDGHLITGDENIIHTEWTVLYTVSNAEKYYLSCLTPSDPRMPDQELFSLDAEKRKLGTRGPRTLLSSLLENAVLKVTASQKVEDSLYKNAGAYTDKVKALFKKEVADVDIGVIIDDLRLKANSPPAAVKAAFEDVTQAAQESQSKQSTASSYATEVSNRADAESAQINAEAQAYRKRVVSEVESEKVYFEQILERYNENPETVLVTLYNQTLSQVMAAVKENYVLSSSPGTNREVRLKLNPEPPTASAEKSVKKGKN